MDSLKQERKILTGKIHSNGSEDSNLDSWCSCLDNLTDSEKTDSEVEDSNLINNKHYKPPKCLVNQIDNESNNFHLDKYFHKVLLIDNNNIEENEEKISDKIIQNDYVKVQHSVDDDGDDNNNNNGCTENEEKNNLPSSPDDGTTCDVDDKTVKDEDNERSIVNTSIVDKQEEEEGNNNNNLDMYPSLNIITCNNNLKSDEDVDEDPTHHHHHHSNNLKYLKRSSSLKTKKTPPGTPGCKKIVRFADALGLDLADVRTFLDEIPKIPISAYEDLKFDFQTPSEEPTHQCPLMLVPLFQQPGLKMDFMEKINNQKICLETMSVTDPSVLAITGYARVRNIGYHKSVYVRYSLNNWKTFSDLQATYVPNSCDGYSDKFLFVLYGHTLKSGEKLEFALRLECCGEQYWDIFGK
ncbi:protein phosphatase 1 binding protein, putative [Pediculus humanus corporis]|uniref:Protein phosphatase 1 binding protein, putative n=1 Tax=Pediculus humanus subsp. corporis TaxID=121224 RepID=E0VV08_PEDHC|nr:protein phosphatase 1 binding protein, putative [Pediculus humanus corporis]EEB17214.1 protein phosphatase 1 binding protein, putative [Pediculus humanus corporis]